MTPAENIYRSDFDDVDGLDPVEFTNESIDTLRGMMEDDQYDIYDADDDGQPTLQEEYHDLYTGDDYIGDMFLDVVDYPEDWGKLWTCHIISTNLKLKIYRTGFVGQAMRSTKLRGEDVEAWENIVRSGAKELRKDIRRKVMNEYTEQSLYDILDKHETKVVKLYYLACSKQVTRME